MRTLMLITAGTFAGLLAASLAATQTQPLPGPGSGVVPIKGTVNIGNSPAVMASQAGDWKVSVTNTPLVSIESPDFVKNDARYTVTWSTGESETFRVTQVGKLGWLRVDQDGRVRWINLATARSIEAPR